MTIIQDAIWLYHFQRSDPSSPWVQIQDNDQVQQFLRFVQWACILILLRRIPNDLWIQTDIQPVIRLHGLRWRHGHQTQEIISVCDRLALGFSLYNQVGKDMGRVHFRIDPSVNHGTSEPADQLHLETVWPGQWPFSPNTAH